MRLGPQQMGRKYSSSVIIKDYMKLNSLPMAINGGDAGNR